MRYKSQTNAGHPEKPGTRVRSGTESMHTRHPKPIARAVPAGHREH